MSDEKSGDKNPNPPKDQNAGNVPQNTVPKDDFDKLATEAATYKKTLQTIQSDYDALKSKIEESERKAKETGGDFKSLYEQEKNARAESESKLTKLKESMILTQKYKAANEALVKAGLRPEAIKLLDKEDFADLEVEHTSQGRMLVHGADLFVDKFKKEYPFAFAEQKPPTMNSGGGSGSSSGGDISVADLLAAEKKFGSGSKEYLDTFEKYKKAKLSRQA